MKILISGINGFVGRILRRSLEERGHDVFGIDLRGGDNSAVFTVDITDIDAVSECVSELSPDAVFHLAAVSKVHFDNPGLLYAINVTGTLNLLSAAAACDPLPRFLLVSSSQVYGRVDSSVQPISEDQAITPINHYGSSKAAIELVGGAFFRVNGLPLVTVRPFNHIGRGQDPFFVVPKIIRAFKEKASELVLGNIETVRDFVDVRDVVDAYISLIEEGPAGETFNIAGGTGYRISDIIRLLEEITGTVIPITRDESFVRTNEIDTIVGDNSKISNMIGWRPRYSMRETLEWILSE